MDTKETKIATATLSFTKPDGGRFTKHFESDSKYELFRMVDKFISTMRKDNLLPDNYQVFHSYE